MCIRCRAYYFIPGLFLTFICLLNSAESFAQFERLPDANTQLQLLKKTVTDTARIRLMYNVANFYIDKPGENKPDFDSAFAILRQSVPLMKKLNNPVWSGKYYLLYSKGLRESGDAKNGRMHLDSALFFFSQNNLAELEGDAMRDLNQYYPCRTNEEAALKVPILKKMVSLYETAGAKEKQAEGLVILADIYGFMDDCEHAVVLLEKSLSIYQSIHYKSLQSVYDLLGVCYRSIGDVQRAIRYGLLAIQTAHQVKDTGMIVTFYNRVGRSFFQANMLTEAGIYFNKSLEAARNIGDTSDMILLGSHLADVYLKQQKPALALKELQHIEKDFGKGSLIHQMHIYSAMVRTLTTLRQYAAAQEYINKLATVDKLVSPSYHHYETLVEYYLATANYSKVAAYADSFETYNKKRNSKLDGEMVHLWRFKVDSAKGKLRSAIDEYQLYKKLEDTAFNEKSIKEISRLNIIYESDRKDNAILSNQLSISALRKEDRLKSAEIKSTRFARNVIIGSTCMLLVLLGLVFNQYRIKQKSNEDLLIKQQEINRQNLTLQQLVDEKEWLVKEIHHRVKNNLQVVMSLLNTQSDFSDNPSSFAAIQESRQRMFAMSLIHQKLYQAEQLTLVNMANYIPELVDFLKDSFADGDRIRFELRVCPIDLDISQAIPVGLILNELITNAIKYAFENKARGTINIILAMQDDSAITLSVADNGKGLPGGSMEFSKNTMGMQLIQTLTDQLRGSVSFTNSNGLQVQLVFSRKLIADTVSS